MNPYSGKIEKFTEEELKAANEALKQKYGQEAKQMIGLTDEEAKKLKPMNRAERRKPLKSVP
jgi:hypothetical protein